jgi:DNA-binding NtrC family response regulator
MRPAVLTWSCPSQNNGMKSIGELSSPVSLPAVAGTFVLVVDDEVAVRRFAVRVLQGEGYVVTEASDGAEALDVIKQGGTSFEVVVSDIVMPRLNGVELMQAIAATHPALPVILISGYATGALAERGIVTPCAILPKPFRAEQLLEEVRRCCRPKNLG